MEHKIHNIVCIYGYTKILCFASAIHHWQCYSRQQHSFGSRTTNKNEHCRLVSDHATSVYHYVQIFGEEVSLWKNPQGIFTKIPSHPRSTNLAMFLLASLGFPVLPFSSRTDRVVLGEMNCERQRPNSGSPPLSMLSYRRSWSLTVP